MLDELLSTEIELQVDGGRLLYRIPEETAEKYLDEIRRWKPELIRMLNGDYCGDVGQCEQCGADLIGLPVAFDGYVNRVCGHCGTWHRCIAPAVEPSSADALEPVKAEQSDLLSL
jgi:hypothetical protein